MSTKSPSVTIYVRNIQRTEDDLALDESPFEKVWKYQAPPSGARRDYYPSGLAGQERGYTPPCVITLQTKFETILLPAEQT